MPEDAERRRAMLTDDDRSFIAECSETAAALAALNANMSNLASDMSEVKKDVREVKDRPTVSVTAFEQVQQDVRALRRQVFIWMGGLGVLSVVVVPVLLYLLYIHIGQ